MALPPTTDWPGGQLRGSRNNRTWLTKKPRVCWEDRYVSHRGHSGCSWLLPSSLVDLPLSLSKLLPILVMLCLPLVPTLQNCNGTCYHWVLGTSCPASFLYNSVNCSLTQATSISPRGASSRGNILKGWCPMYRQECCFKHLSLYTVTTPWCSLWIRNPGCL